jgi:hypothetical protein
VARLYDIQTKKVNTLVRCVCADQHRQWRVHGQARGRGQIVRCAAIMWRQLLP